MTKQYNESGSSSRGSFKYRDLDPAAISSEPVEVIMLDKHDWPGNGKFYRSYVIITKPIDTEGVEDGLIRQLEEGEVAIAVPEAVVEQIAFHLDMSRRKEHALTIRKEGHREARAPEVYRPQLKKTDGD